jgi:hypothetical protein
VIKEKKINKMNEVFSEWEGASAEILDFRDSMSNALILGVFKDGKQARLRLAACQHINTNVYLNNVSFYCEQTNYEGHDCFLLKDHNSSLQIVVGSAIQLGDLTVTVSD